MSAEPVIAVVTRDIAIGVAILRLERHEPGAALAGLRWARDHFAVSTESPDEPS